MVNSRYLVFYLVKISVVVSSLHRKGRESQLIRRANVANEIIKWKIKRTDVQIRGQKWTFELNSAQQKCRIRISLSSIAGRHQKK